MPERPHTSDDRVSPLPVSGSTLAHFGYNSQPMRTSRPCGNIHAFGTRIIAALNRGDDHVEFVVQ